MNTVWLNVGAYGKTWSHILQKNHYPFQHRCIKHFNTKKFDLVKFHCCKVKSVFNLINSPMPFHKAKAAFSQWKLTE